MNVLVSEASDGKAEKTSNPTEAENIEDTVNPEDLENAENIVDIEDEEGELWI